MNCWCECGKPVEVYVADHGSIAIHGPLRPGAIIECDDPQSVKGYCKECWEKTIKGQPE